MSSIETKDFEVTLTKFIDGYNLIDWETKRLALLEIYYKVEAKANAEIMQGAADREAEKKE